MHVAEESFRDGDRNTGNGVPLFIAHMRTTGTNRLRQCGHLCVCFTVIGYNSEFA